MDSEDSRGGGEGRRRSEHEESDQEEDVRSEGESSPREDDHQDDTERGQDSEGEAEEPEHEAEENHDRKHKREPEEGHRHSEKEHAGDSTEFKPCCAECVKDNRHNRRSCVCQVPASQRRTNLGADGCITCHCHGCHPEDQEKRVKDGEKAIVQESASGEKHPMPADDVLKNGCCKKCMRAFSETKKACICQVPIDVRMGTIPEGGCRICGCKGCHPDEIAMRKQGLVPMMAPQPRGRRGGQPHHIPAGVPMMIAPPMRGMPAHYIQAPPPYMRDPREYAIYATRGPRGEIYQQMPYPYDPFGAPGVERYLRRSPPRDSGRKRGRSRTPSRSPPRRGHSPRHSEPDRYRPSPPRHDDKRDQRKDSGGWERDGGRDSARDSGRDNGRDGGRDNRDSRDSRDSRDRDNGRDSRDYGRDGNRDAGRDIGRDAARDSRESRDSRGSDNRGSRDSRDDREAGRKRDARRFQEFDRRGGSPVKRPRERR